MMMRAASRIQLLKTDSVSAFMSTKLLLVDDEPLLLTFLSTVLQEEGYEVFVARDGKQAIQIANRVAVDLVITDLVMPETEGLGLIQYFHKTLPAVKMIAMSGAFDGQYLVPAGLLGAHAVLRKPFEARELVEMVARLLPRDAAVD
jgi:DNA-binding response OmpR family regulator